MQTPPLPTPFELRLVEQIDGVEVSLAVQIDAPVAAPSASLWSTECAACGSGPDARAAALRHLMAAVRPWLAQVREEALASLERGALEALQGQVEAERTARANRSVA